MELHITLQGVEQITKKYKPEKIAEAIKNALNRSVRSGRTEASDAIRNKLGMNIKKSDLDQKITIRTANVGQTEAALIVRGEPIILSYFGAKQCGTFVAVNRGQGAGRYGMASRLKGKRGHAGPVTVEIIKGKRVTLDNRTFIAMGRHGVPMVFRRQASGKLIGKKVYAHHSMLQKPVVIESVKNKIIATWDKEWANQIRQLNKGQTL